MNIYQFAVIYKDTRKATGNMTAFVANKIENLLNRSKPFWRCGNLDWIEPCSVQNTSSWHLQNEATTVSNKFQVKKEYLI